MTTDKEKGNLTDMADHKIQICYYNVPIPTHYRVFPAHSESAN